MSAARQPAVPASYEEAVRSTTVIGGASALNLVLGLVRNKWLAVQLGPAGVGLFTNYSQIAQMMGALAGLGLNHSGVRQIAEAAATGDRQQVGRTIHALRRLAWIGAGAGALLLAGFAPWIAQFTFNEPGHAAAVRWLGLVVFLTALSGAQVALIQGLRRIGDLARVNVIGALVATVTSIPAIWWWGERGLIPFMVVVAAATILVSGWTARRIIAAPAACPWRDTWQAARGLLSLGGAMLLSALLVAGVGYLTRVILQRQIDLEAAGHYHAAALVATYCVNFILQGLGADFYPRLTAVAQDDAAMGRSLNEQTEVSLLISGPAIMGALALAPALLIAMNSAAFLPAVPLLRWLLLGTILRVASWLLGFVVLAKGNAPLFVATEIAANVLMLGTTWVAVRTWGLVGAGVAYTATYLLYWLMMIVVARRLIRFRFSRANGRVLALALGGAGAAFACQWLAPAPWRAPLGLALTLPVGVYGLNALCRLVPGSRPARLWRSALAKAGISA